MKIAVGLRQAELIQNRQYLQFLRQIGVTHILGFMYDKDVIASAKDGYYDADELKSLVRYFHENGLEFEAIENFPAFFWHKVLMDLPGKEKQMENLKRTITNMGKAGIPIMGYNFSAGGVIGRYPGEMGRGNVKTVGYDPVGHPFENGPIPRSMAWNRIVEPEVLGDYGRIDREEMRGRLYRFLEEMLPVCEEAKVALAAHPEDPPVPYLREAGRVLISPEDYDAMFKAFPSKYCTVEFCQGTFSEMGIDLYETIEKYASAGRISYVHLRNTRGKVPNYIETMIDDGDVDMGRALMCYYKGGFEGTMIPDHYPVLSGTTTDHGSVAFAIGYMRGLMHALNIPIYGEQR